MIDRPQLNGQLFQPHPLAQGGNIQTFLARLKPLGKTPVTQAEQPILIDAGYDHTGFAPERSVQLLGFYTPHQTDGPGRGLVLLLHGWEGSSHSSYNLLIGSEMIRRGYDVFRLNYRDHGPTHHLNPGFFYATLIEEVATATQWISQLAGSAPFYIVGASLGGNFALRLAIWHARHPFNNLQHVVAINPAVNPSRTSDTLEQHTLYHLYFRRRWLYSLQRKQALFPHLYDFSPLRRMNSIRAMSDWLVKRYGKFADVEAYFASYAVSPRVLGESLTVPTTIITAEDDPIIPVDDFRALPDHPLLHVQIHPTGGHVGFTDIFPMRHHLPELVLGAIANTH